MDVARILSSYRKEYHAAVASIYVDCGVVYLSILQLYLSQEKECWVYTRDTFAHIREITRVMIFRSSNHCNPNVIDIFSSLLQSASRSETRMDANCHALYSSVPRFCSSVFSLESNVLLDRAFPKLFCVFALIRNRVVTAQDTIRVSYILVVLR